MMMIIIIMMEWLQRPPPSLAPDQEAPTSLSLLAVK
jgi:hypothetical protein